jgi:hypothetical protein
VVAKMVAVEADTEATDTSARDDRPIVTRRQLVRLAARAPDSYVLVLVLLMVDYTLVTVNWTGNAAFITRTVTFGLTAVLAFHTSRVRPSVQNAVRIAVAVTIVASIGAAVDGTDTAVGAANLLVSVVLVAIPIAIGWRILHHQQVTGETIAGAICIYALIGMIFANVDYGVQLASGHSFFAQPGNHGLPDFAYFSYVTMATVGYGDLSPATGLPRTLSVFDALIGQVFLVTLLARLVSLYRGPIGWRREIEQRLRQESEPGGASGA